VAQVSMEIMEPYERRDNDVIVSIRKTVTKAGMPPKTESLYIRLKDKAIVSDKEIEHHVMSRIYEHPEKMPEEI
jgi:hypothetical protein